MYTIRMLVKLTRLWGLLGKISPENVCVQETETQNTGFLKYVKLT